MSGLEFLVFSVVEVVKGKAYPIASEQTVRNKAEKVVVKVKLKKRHKKAKGRPKGSLNKDKKQLELSPELLRVNSLLSKTLKLLRQFVKLKYLALDGHFGHNQAVLMTVSNGLDLISKLRKDSALCEIFDGEYGGKGRKTEFGKQLNYENLPQKYWKKGKREGEIITNYYQGIFLHRSFGMKLNVVIIERINVQTKKTGNAILFSSDLELGWEKLLEYYSLRFQIEFNFRDAKQHFGLEDFMNTTKTGVENAANLALMMVNVSAKLLKNSEANCVGIGDLKTHFRGVKYALEAIKILQEKAEIILMKETIEEVKQKLSKFGSIHQAKVAHFTP